MDLKGRQFDSGHLHFASMRLNLGPSIEYRCPCGKKGSHEHDKKFTAPQEGLLFRDNGSMWKIIRQLPGYIPTWTIERLQDNDNKG